MAALSDMRAFLRRLDESNETELLVLRNKMRDAKEYLRDPAIMAEADYLLKKIEQELLDRSWKL